jgi:DNA (cytosine-5)-methyltransferase 1
LYRTCKVGKVKVERLQGVCWVKFIDQADTSAIEDWIMADSVLDRYFTNTCQSTDSKGFVPMDEGDFQRHACGSCMRKHEQDTEQYQLRNGRISCMDVFSGAGGLSAGMARTDYFDTKWVIEQSPSAAQTFK